MRILVTNDDGIDSIGLHVLARAMRPYGEVVVAAPDQEYSGAGAAIGAVVLGGVGAVVGSVSSGNKTTIEQIINIGIKLKDSNWVVVTANVNDSIVGKAEKKAVNDLLEMTRKQQQAPF
jgi:5'/3'-nucleotidase SurE